MIRRKNLKKFWSSTLALNLVSLTLSGAAWGADAAPAKVRFNDLTVSELNTFMNFEAVKEGTDPNNRAVLYGMVFDDCKAHFQFSNSKLDGTNRSQGVIGFRVTDKDGAGRGCMEEHRKANHACSEATPCTRISQLPGANLDLSGEGDVKIQLLHIDANRDRDQRQWEDFSTSLSHVSAATIRDERLREEKKRREKVVDVLKKQVSACRKNEKDRDTARSARDMLADMGLLDSDQVDRITREIDKAEFNELARKWEKLNPRDTEAVDEMAEQLKAYEAEHPESADSVAVLFHNMAKKVVKGPKSGPEHFDRASEMIAQAQSLGGLNELAQTRLENYQRDISVGRFQNLAQNGGAQDPYGFWMPYQNFMGGLQTEMRSCNGPNMTSESCRSMVQAYRSASQIPAQAQQSQYEQYMFYMQMQQQMAQVGGGGMMMNGMPGTTTSGFYR